MYCVTTWLLRPTRWNYVVIDNAGFRPGSRGPVVSAKGPKTIDALSGLIWMNGRERLECGPTRCAHTRPADLSERSLMGAGQQASVSTKEKRERKKLRYAQTLRAFLRNRLHNLSSPQGHGSLVKERATESLEFLRDGIDVIFFCCHDEHRHKKILIRRRILFLISVILTQGSRHGSRPGPA